MPENGPWSPLGELCMELAIQEQCSRRVIVHLELAMVQDNDSPSEVDLPLVMFQGNDSLAGMDISTELVMENTCNLFSCTNLKLI